ncbi:MAG TPA: hypothetical protein VHX86_01210 [Tepidisphaeraceae bacterium]|nr:hypothetical protein [Tepidisphaeraceae bacterium]
MFGFVRHHVQHLDRWSSALMFLVLGHLILSRVGDAGILVAAALVFVAACFRAWQFEMAGRGAA